jgi:protein-L-isoaspartate(D-aspartate) O-methyltransferase
MEIKAVLPAHPQSYEKLFHLTNKPAFLLPLRAESDRLARAELSKPKLERAIGVIYRPETERYSHYFEATLSQQFDEFIWFDETRAVTPIGAKEVAGMPETYPFGV